MKSDYIMMRIQQTITCILILLLFTPKLFAQKALLTSGADIYTNNGSLSFSVGQVDYVTISTNSGSISQGVQQPYEIYVITATDDIAFTNLKCTAYPNPTTDFLTLAIENNNLKGLSYQLTNSSGRLLENAQILDAKTTLPMQNYTPAVYFLRVNDENEVIRIFKIIKH